MSTISEKLSSIARWISLSVRIGFYLGATLFEKIRLAFFLFTARVPGFNHGAYKTFHIRIEQKNADIAIRRLAADVHILSEILVDRWYDKGLPKVAPGIIFDVGANIGIVTLYMKLRYPDAVVYAFEPDPASFAVLEHNIKSLKNVKAFNVGLWNKQDTLMFHRSKHFDTRNSFILKEGDSTTISVPVITYADALALAGVDVVDFMKFDIEGAEVELFSGIAHTTLRSFFGELHPALRTPAVMRDILATLERDYRLEVEEGSDAIWHVSGTSASTGHSA